MKRVAIVTTFCLLFSFSPVQSSNALFGLECKKPRATYTEFLAKSRVSSSKAQTLTPWTKPYDREWNNVSRLRGIAYTAVLTNPKCFTAKQIYDAKRYLE